MKVVALISGGKDSCYAMQLAQDHGHEVVALANLLPRDDQPDDLNSFMYQTVGHQLVEAYATCTGLPLFRRHIRGASRRQDLQYTVTEGDEVEDLYALLAFVKRTLPCVGAVASGAIASDYQRLRVEHVCARLHLVSLAYMWHQPQRALLRGMIDSGLHAVLVKVAALGLDPWKHLGQPLAALQPTLLRLADSYGLHVCGEGGEYESLTLDCRLFTHARIVLDESEVVVESNDGMAPVAHLRPTKFHLETKADVVDAAKGAVDGMGVNGGAGHPHPHDAVVHVVPEEFVPGDAGPAGLAWGRGASIERRPGLASILHLKLRQEGDYVQVTCCCTLPDHAALAADVTENDAANALHDILTAVRARLAEAGLGLGQALYVNLLLGNMGHFAAANAVYCRILPATDPPSRTCVQLPLPPGVPVMVDVLLAQNAAHGPAPGGGSDGGGGAGTVPNPPGPKHVLHVQSISSWAPSCIGPYSQATGYNGLLRLAGSLPLDPASMMVVGESPGDQLRMAIRHVHVIGVALRTHALGAALSLVVYYASSIGPAGREELHRTMAELLDTGLGALQAASARPKRAALAGFGGPPGPRQLGTLLVEGECDEEEQEVGNGEGEGEDNDVQGPQDGLDPYLQVPHIRRSVRGNAVFVAVPALPRGCLVEVQATLLDSAWLEAREEQAAGSDSDDEGGAPAAPCAEPDRGCPPLPTDSQGDDADPSSAAQLASFACSASQDLARLRSRGSGKCKAAVGAGQGAACYTPEDAVLLPQRPASHARHNSATQDSCHMSVRSSVDFDSLVDDADVPPPGPDAQLPTPSATQGGAPTQPPDGAGNVMVTTVHCEQYGILKSLFHLPADVFSRPGTSDRLQDAVASVLRGYGLRMSDVVQARAWYDVALGRDLVLESLHSEARDGWHVTWLPCLHVGSTMLTNGAAAVMEVLVRASPAT